VGGLGVEIKESPVTDEEFAEMSQFVADYLAASVNNEEDGGRMRWYPWHSAEYRYNHIRNVVSIAAEIAEREGAAVDVTRVAALFHDVAKLSAEQDAHAAVGAHIAREWLTTRAEYPPSFVESVCSAIEEHSYQGDLAELPLETRCLLEADLLDKVGANGLVLLFLRMGYESHDRMNAADVAGRVVERGRDVNERVVSDTAESLAHQRLERATWFREWLESEIAGIEPNDADPAEDESETIETADPDAETGSDTR
jgi:uncharacterized protein